MIIRPIRVIYGTFIVQKLFMSMYTFLIYCDLVNFVLVPCI